MNITQDEIDALYCDADLLAALSAEVKPVREKGFGITAAELAENTGVSRTTAERLLSDKLKSSELERTEMLQDGNAVNVYHRKAE